MNSNTTDDIGAAMIAACRKMLAEGLAEQRERERAAARARRLAEAEVDHACRATAGKVVDFLEFRARWRYEK